MSFMIETSARHIHLTQETVEKLFGKGYELTIRKPLSYPGQYACNERLTIVGPKKEMANVSILGPVRKADQVEVSATDARTLGIAAPVRESGDVRAPVHVSWWVPPVRWSCPRASSWPSATCTSRRRTPRRWASRIRRSSALPAAARAVS